MKIKTKKDARLRRRHRVRKKVSGTADKPRMAVFVSNVHAYVQFIDDTQGVTLAAVSTLDKKSSKSGSGNNRETAKVLGTAAAQAAKDKGINEVVFDRGGFTYTGKIKVLAEAAREGGLTF